MTARKLAIFFEATEFDVEQVLELNENASGISDNAFVSMLEAGDALTTLKEGSDVFAIPSMVVLGTVVSTSIGHNSSFTDFALSENS